MSLPSFRAAFPLYPAAAAMVLECARQLSGSQQGWRGVEVVHAEAAGRYVLRGVSRRLERQQRVHHQQQQQQQQVASISDSAAEAALPAAAVALNNNVAPSSSLGPALMGPSAPPPPYQYVVPVEAHAVWRNDT